MPGATDDMEDGVNLPYTSNCVLDRDIVATPKQEFLSTWDTPDFFEFDRTFKCTRAEFIYLIKGIAFEKQFTLSMFADNFCRSYRLLNFRCTEMVAKIRKKADKSKIHMRCTFFLQYIEEPDRPDVYTLHAHEQTHKHELDADIPHDLVRYFQ